MDRIVQAHTPPEAAPSPAEQSPVARRAAEQARPAASGDSSALQGVSLVDASATIGSGRNLVADYVMGANNQIEEIRVIDPTTHQVIAASPPDSIARMQQEIAAYQGVASQSKSGLLAVGD